MGPQACHVLHGQFADSVVVGGLGGSGLIQHAFGLVAVNVGAAGQQYARRGLGQGGQRGQQVARTQQVDPVEGVGIAMADKGDGGQVDDSLGAGLGYGMRQRGAIHQVGLQVVLRRNAQIGRGGLRTQAPDLPAALLQRGLHVAPGKAAQPGDEHPAGWLLCVRHVRTRSRLDCGANRPRPSFGTAVLAWFEAPNPAWPWPWLGCQ